MKNLKLYILTIFSLLFKNSFAAAMLPTGANVIHGDSVISSQNKLMAISSSSKNNVIAWNDFSVGVDHIVQFDNKNYLNIVKSANPSVINGTIQSLPGGKVHLVNPNGITLGKDSKFLCDKITLSTSKISSNEVNSFLEGNDFVPSKKGMGNITLLGYIRTKNLVIDGSKVMIKDIGNIHYGTVTTQAGIKLDNKSNNNFEIYSSTKRIDIGGSTDINLQEDYGFTKEIGVVSQLGKTAISDKNDFLNITNDLNGDYFLTNDINLGDLSNANISNNNTFSGSIDGAFNTVTYSINKENIKDSSLGLFSKLDNATVENLKIDDAKFDINNCTSNCNIGALAGSITNSQINNVEVNNLKLNLGNNTQSANIGGIAGSFEAGHTQSSLSNVNVSISKDSNINAKNKFGFLAGLNNDNLILKEAVFSNNGNEIKSFGENKALTTVNNASYSNNKDFIEMNNEWHNKNFYNPFFIDSDISFEYDNNNPKEYNYLNLVDNPYFTTSDYVNINFTYEDPIKNIGEYSHIYSSKDNGTLFYFVHNGLNSQSANHKVSITGINYKENQDKYMAMVNNKVKDFSNYKNQVKQSSIFDELEVNSNGMNTDYIRAYRLNLPDDFIFDRKFLASVGLEYSVDKQMLTKLNEKLDELG